MGYAPVLVPAPLSPLRVPAQPIPLVYDLLNPEYNAWTLIMKDTHDPLVIHGRAVGTKDIKSRVVVQAHGDGLYGKGHGYEEISRGRVLRDARGRRECRLYRGRQEFGSRTRSC
jgi:hypothetical protein